MDTEGFEGSEVILQGSASPVSIDLSIFKLLAVTDASKTGTGRYTNNLHTTFGMFDGTSKLACDAAHISRDSHTSLQ